MKLDKFTDVCMTGGIRHIPSHTNICKFFTFQLAFSQLILHLICWNFAGLLIKVKVLFLVLVYVFNFNLLEFSAAILEKGLLGHTHSICDLWIGTWRLLRKQMKARPDKGCILYLNCRWKIKKNSSYNSNLSSCEKLLIQTHDLCDAVAGLYQMSYQANWELVILWVNNMPVKDK